MHGTRAHRTIGGETAIVEAGFVCADDPAAYGQRSPAGGDARLVYGNACGRLRLTNVTVRNAGIDWQADGNVYWRHRVRSNPEVTPRNPGL